MALVGSDTWRRNQPSDPKLNCFLERFRAVPSRSPSPARELLANAAHSGPGSARSPPASVMTPRSGSAWRQQMAWLQRRPNSARADRPASAGSKASADIGAAAAQSPATLQKKPQLGAVLAAGQGVGCEDAIGDAGVGSSSWTSAGGPSARGLRQEVLLDVTAASASHDGASLSPSLSSQPQPPQSMLLAVGRSPKDRQVQESIMARHIAEFRRLGVRKAVVDLREGKYPPLQHYSWYPQAPLDEQAQHEMEAASEQRALAKALQLSAGAAPTLFESCLPTRAGDKISMRPSSAPVRRPAPKRYSLHGNANVAPGELQPPAEVVPPVEQFKASAAAYGQAQANPEQLANAVSPPWRAADAALAARVVRPSSAPSGRPAPRRHYNGSCSVSAPGAGTSASSAAKAVAAEHDVRVVDSVAQVAPPSAHFTQNELCKDLEDEHGMGQEEGAVVAEPARKWQEEDEQEASLGIFMDSEPTGADDDLTIADCTSCGDSAPSTRPPSANLRVAAYYPPYNQGTGKQIHRQLRGPTNVAAGVRPARPLSAPETRQSVAAAKTAKTARPRSALQIRTWHPSLLEEILDASEDESLSPLLGPCGGFPEMNDSIGTWDLPDATEGCLNNNRNSGSASSSRPASASLLRSAADTVAKLVSDRDKFHQKYSISSDAYGSEDGTRAPTPHRSYGTACSSYMEASTEMDEDEWYHGSALQGAPSRPLSAGRRPASQSRPVSAGHQRRQSVSRRAGDSQRSASLPTPSRPSSAGRYHVDIINKSSVAPALQCRAAPVRDNSRLGLDDEEEAQVVAGEEGQLVMPRFPVSKIQAWFDRIDRGRRGWIYRAELVRALQTDQDVFDVFSIAFAVQAFKQHLDASSAEIEGINLADARKYCSQVNVRTKLLIKGMRLLDRIVRAAGLDRARAKIGMLFVVEYFRVQGLVFDYLSAPDLNIFDQRQLREKAVPEEDSGDVGEGSEQCKAFARRRVCKKHRGPKDESEDGHASEGDVVPLPADRDAALRATEAHEDACEQQQEAQGEVAAAAARSNGQADESHSVFADRKLKEAFRLDAQIHEARADETMAPAGLVASDEVPALGNSCATAEAVEEVQAGAVVAVAAEAVLKEDIDGRFSLADDGLEPKRAEAQTAFGQALAAAFGCPEDVQCQQMAHVDTVVAATDVHPRADPHECTAPVSRMVPGSREQGEHARQEHVEEQNRDQHAGQRKQQEVDQQQQEFPKHWQRQQKNLEQEPYWQQQRQQKQQHEQQRPQQQRQQQEEEREFQPRHRQQQRHQPEGFHVTALHSNATEVTPIRTSDCALKETQWAKPSAAAIVTGGLASALLAAVAKPSGRERQNSQSSARKAVPTESSSPLGAGSEPHAPAPGERDGKQQPAARGATFRHRLQRSAESGRDAVARSEWEPSAQDAPPMDCLQRGATSESDAPAAHVREECLQRSAASEPDAPLGGALAVASSEAVRSAVEGDASAASETASLIESCATPNVKPVTRIRPGSKLAYGEDDGDVDSSLEVDALIQCSRSPASSEILSTSSRKSLLRISLPTPAWSADSEQDCMSASSTQSSPFCWNLMPAVGSPRQLASQRT